jgi:hypothetical protein
MLLRWIAALCAACALSGCSTPYRLPVFVYGGAEFQGIAGVIEKSGSQPVDVVMVHGMCTNTSATVNAAIDGLLTALDSNIPPAPPAEVKALAETNEIQIVKRQATIGGVPVRFSALVWSPLTTPLKQQLAYDMTGEPTDCSVAGECKPRRAKFNGQFKDGLLNDCLADVMIYQGISRKAIREKMVEAITQVVDQSDAQARADGTEPGTLVLVAASLGSKISFDALDEMVHRKAPGRHRSAGESAVRRLGLIFMEANQLPILGLADQEIESAAARSSAAPAAPEDSLQRILQLKANRQLNAISLTSLTLVAFTDPNDLLSYRLQPSRYAVPGVAVADVLVSNDTTYFGRIERPDRAHTGYSANPAVTSLISCGHPKSALCK